MISFEFTGEDEPIRAVLYDGTLQTNVGQTAELSPQQEALVAIISQAQDTPFLATELRRADAEALGAKSVLINDVFEEVRNIFTPLGLGESLLKIGKERAGKSTHYGMLSSLDDDALLDFAHRGLYKVSKRSVSGVQRYRQELPFKAMIKQIEEPDEIETHTNRKRLAYGGAVIALTLGTASTLYMIMKSRD